MRGKGDQQSGRRAGRVAIVHRQTAVGLGLAVGFVLAAAATLAFGGSRWAALHLLLVGGVTNAVAAATVMLAVTWATAPPPAAWSAAAARLLLALGPVAVVVGRERDLIGLVHAGAATTALGLVSVAAMLVGIRTRATLERFHPAIDAYVLAALIGVIGTALGAVVAAGRPVGSWTSWRAAHLTLNLTGFVGLVIAATLPFFVATQARMRMNQRATTARIRFVLAAYVATVAVAVGARASAHPLVAGLALGAQAVVVTAVLAMVPRPGRAQWAWAGPRLGQLAAGVLWWIGTTIWWAVVIAQQRDEAPVLAPLAVGGFAQIVVAGLAYLGPVVRAGGADRLRAGFTVTGSWFGLLIANVAAVALAGSARTVATIALGLWALDALVRTLRLGLRRRPAPTSVRAVPAGDPR